MKFSSSNQWAALFGALLILSGCVTTTPRETAAPAAAPLPTPASAPAVAAVAIATPTPSEPAVATSPTPATTTATIATPPAVAATPKPAVVAKPQATTTPLKPIAAAAKPALAPPPEKTTVVDKAAATGSERIAGHIELVAAPGQQISADEAANTVVYFVPAGGAPKPKPGRHSVITRAKRFDPAVLAVTAGSTVAFPNQDEILHNVFSLSPGATFDLGLYGEGQSAETVFNRATVVQIFCNVHHSMHADILVLATPWFARVGGNGAFALEALPAGAGTLNIWHPRAGLVAREVTLPLSAPLQEKLLAVKPGIPEHKRKDGEGYRPVAR